jgi:acyl-CoA synthetase (NDP forming)
LIAFDAFPPRIPGEIPWADPVLTKAIELQRETGVTFASVTMGPLSYIAEAKDFTRKWGRLPFLQGHHASTKAIKALIDYQSVRERATPDLPAHPARAAALRVLKGLSGPVDEATGAKLLELYGVRRPDESVVATPAKAAEAARAIRGPVAVKALAPEIPHKARLGGVRLGLHGAAEVEVAAAEVLEAARRGGAASPKVLVQEMVRGHEVLVGAIVDRQFGASITMRPGGALAEAGAAVFVAAPLTARQALDYVRSQAAHCGLNEDEHDLRSTAKAVEAMARAAHDLRHRLRSFEANPLLVGPKGAVAVDALAEVGPAE